MGASAVREVYGLGGEEVKQEKQNDTGSWGQTERTFSKVIEK